MLNLCEISFTFDNADRIFEIGERVTGSAQLTPTRQLRCDGVRLELFWRTHGRGNRAQGEAIPLGVDFNEPQLEPGQTYSVPFSFDAPPGPLTYRGHYLNIDWYVQATLDVPLVPGFADPKEKTEFLILPKEGVTTNLGPKHTAPLDSETLTVSTIQWPIIIFGAVFSGFSLLFILPTLSSGSGMSLLFAVLPLIFFLVGLVMIFSGFRNRLASQRLGEVTVEFDRRELVPGETVTCRVRFTPKQAVDLDKVQLELSAQERVVSGSGTKKKTHKHTLFEEKRNGSEATRLEPGREFDLTESFTLPLDAPYSFAAKDNELIWQLKVFVDTKGILDWSHSYALVVLPWRDGADLL